jgi:hypothetical protein
VLPRLLEKELHIESKDPVTGNCIRLSIDPHGLRAIEPESAVASMIATNEIDLQENAALHFCNHVRHLTSGTTAAGFVEGNPGRYIVALPEFDSAAESLYSALWSSRGNQ